MAKRRWMNQLRRSEIRLAGQRVTYAVESRDYDKAVEIALSTSRSKFETALLVAVIFETLERLDRNQLYVIEQIQRRAYEPR